MGGTASWRREEGVDERQSDGGPEGIKTGLLKKDLIIVVIKILCYTMWRQSICVG